MSNNSDFVRSADFPVDEAGCVHHVGVKPGEVANRVITVGEVSRAWKLAGFLDEKKEDLKVIESIRGFTTITGHYQKNPISIVSIGMGTSMMDFFVREIRAVVEGPMMIVRFGSCGSLVDGVGIGSLAVASEAVSCSRNVDHFLEGGSDLPPYNISKPVAGDKDFIELFKSLASSEEKIVIGLNATACSFYSSQARPEIHFRDNNTELLSTLQTKYPHVISFEMESFQLYHLASCSKGNSIRACAVHMVFADRVNNIFMNDELKNIVEPRAGKLVVEAISKIVL